MPHDFLELLPVKLRCRGGLVDLGDLEAGLERRLDRLRKFLDVAPVRVQRALRTLPAREVARDEERLPADRLVPESDARRFVLSAARERLAALPVGKGDLLGGSRCISCLG